MTNDELIARQAKEIVELKDHVAEMATAINRSILRMVCIGGPLNDNREGYTPKQKVIFDHIRNDLQDLEYQEQGNSDG